MNISLLCKWWWRLEKEEGLWQTIVCHKYMKKNNIQNVSHKLNDSAMWYDLLKVKEFYLQNRYVLTKKGDKTRFWLDPWIYTEPVCVVSPVLFLLCEKKQISVAQALSGNELIFRRWLYSDLRNVWNQIWIDAMQFNLGVESDIVLWKWKRY